MVHVNPTGNPPNHPLEREHIMNKRIRTGLVSTALVAGSFIGAGVVSVAVERFAYRPLRYAPRIAPLISALGVSFVLQNIIQITVSPRPLSYGSGTLIATDAAVNFGDLRVHASRILVVIVTLVLILINFLVMVFTILFP